MNKLMLKKQYMMFASKKKDLLPTSALVYTLSDDESYYIVGTGFTSLSSIESDTSGGNAGSGLDSTWSGGDLVIPSRYNGKPVKAIAPKSFVDINNITNIYVQEGITHIGHRAFQIANVTDKTTEYAEIPNGVTYFGGTAGRVFWKRGFKSVKLGSGITSIDLNTFYECSSLTSITIPEGVTSIGQYAFYYCRSLASITIPNSVTSINSYAFEGCASCLLFDFRGATQVPTLSSTDAFRYTPSNKKIVVPDALYDEWKSATNWSSYASYIVKASEYVEA